MKASEQLRRPENWHDFEKLCWKLWGAIWNKPEEIEFNSSNSQGQNGVDIYCRVNEENGYVGIQCKNLKEEKLNGDPNELIISNLKKEIEKAETFEPPLKRFIIATSAEKDGEIQKAIRLISEERISQGKFPVEIKFWDYITFKIDEHKSVHDWYVKSINFKSVHDVKFTFSDDSDEMTASPLFKRPVTVYMYEKPRNPFERNMAIYNSWQKSLRQKSYNHSFVRVQFKIKNTGESPIENWKIKITVDEFLEDICTTNAVKGSYIDAIIPGMDYDFKLSKTAPQILLFNHGKGDILVKNDEYVFDELYVKPKPILEKKTMVFYWELLSKDYNDHGMVILNLSPEIRKHHNDVIVDKSISPLPAAERGDLEDYISHEEIEL